MILYMLPTGQGTFTLWCPASIKQGEIPNDRTVILSPHPLQSDELGNMIHDFVFRFQARRGLPQRHSVSFWFRMIWGAIYLVNLFMGQGDLEDLLCGLYLVAGCPAMANWLEAIWRRHARRVRQQFDVTAYLPTPQVVEDSRLLRLERIIASHGFPEALRALSDIGFPELVEFYRRAAWSGRWITSVPTGIGRFRLEDDHLRPITS